MMSVLKNISGDFEMKVVEKKPTPKSRTKEQRVVRVPLENMNFFSPVPRSIFVRLGFKVLSTFKKDSRPRVKKVFFVGANPKKLGQVKARHLQQWADKNDIKEGCHYHLVVEVLGKAQN